ncbi:MAG: hypothetical protein M1835_006985 [Candelina submexicana]|nr:MAG: hypothetical protein M1835_006985 [Candelina submexicana]
MSTQPFRSPQHPSRGKRSVSFSCPTPLRTPSTPISPISGTTSSPLSRTVSTSPTRPAHSRSVSWAASSGSTDELAYEHEEESNVEGEPRWNEALEKRLAVVERELKHHQKKWSAGQEEYHHELEHLLELKRAFKRFNRRRSKDQKVEGRRFLNQWSLVNSDAEMEDSELDNPQRGIGAALKPRKSAPTTTHTSDEEEGDQGPTTTRRQPPNRRRFSLIQRITSSKEVNDSNESSTSPSRPMTATSTTTTTTGGETESERDAPCEPGRKERGKRNTEKKKKKGFGGLLRRVTFPVWMVGKGG